MRFMRINWGKVLVLVLVCEALLLYWSTIQHSQTVRQLKANSELQQLPVSAVPQAEPERSGKTG